MSSVFEKDSASEEGLAFKKQLLKLLKSNDIKLNDLVDITSSGEEEGEEDEHEDDANAETCANIVEENQELAPADNFLMKFVELKKYVDSELPAAVAKLNTELDMMSKSVTLVQPMSSNDLDTFIWKFHVSFECEGANYSLPIQEVEDIEKLNGALFDEATYHEVVSSNILICS